MLRNPEKPRERTHAHCRRKRKRQWERNSKSWKAAHRKAALRYYHKRKKGAA